MAKKVKKTTKLPIYKSVIFYFVFIYTLLTIAFIFQVYTVNVIPSKFLIPGIAVLIIILTGIVFLQYGKCVNKINQILGRILLIIMCILLGVGNFYLFKTGSAFVKMTGDNSETSVVSIVVMDKSDFKTLKDLKGRKFGINKTGNQNSLDNAVKDLKEEESDITTVDYKSYEEFGNALYENKIDAIILDEGARGLIEDNHPNFSKETRVIKKYEYKSDSKDISKSVKVTNDPFNVYISGIDTYGGISTVSRSDVNMIATINPKTHQILLTSIPRDYYIPQTCQANQKDKLTHTGIFGVNCTIESAENYFGVILNYYARVNFSSLVDIVDAIGGIKVDNPIAFEGLGFSYPAGTIELNGEQALGYSRERYSLADGDRDRGRNQMRVITGIINKVTSPSIITNYASIMDAVGGSFQTNMSNNEMTSLIKMQISDMSGWDIEQIAVNGTGNPSAWSPANGSNAWVMEPNKKTVENALMLIKKVQAGEDVKPLIESINSENASAE